MESSVGRQVINKINRIYSMSDSDQCTGWGNKAVEQ